MKRNVRTEGGIGGRGGVGGIATLYVVGGTTHVCTTTIMCTYVVRFFLCNFHSVFPATKENGPNVTVFEWFFVTFFLLFSKATLLTRHSSLNWGLLWINSKRVRSPVNRSNSPPNWTWICFLLCNLQKWNVFKWKKKKCSVLPEIGHPCGSLHKTISQCHVILMVQLWLENTGQCYEKKLSFTVHSAPQMWKKSRWLSYRGIMTQENQVLFSQGFWFG